MATLFIFAIALAIRLTHVWSIRHAPFFAVLMGDARSYDVWARQIAGGDWVGKDVFYQAPLYPYFLGTLYAVFGRSLVVVRIVQAVVGSCSCVLLADAGQRLFSRRVGITAGLILALYAPAIFFDGVIQKSVLDVFFVCLSIWILARIESGDPAGRPVMPWLGLGLALGGLALTRENALVFVAVILAWVVVRRATPRPARMRHAAAFLCGLALVLAPVAVRNRVVGGGFYLTTSQLGPNLFIGNHVGADGTYQSLRYGRGAPEYEQKDATELAESALERRLTPGEVSRYWSGRAVEFMTGRPTEWLGLMARKTALLVNAAEIIDTEDPSMYAEWSPPLEVLGPIGGFGILLPLAVLGVLNTWRERRRYVVLYALALAYAGSVVLFYVFARYRYPLVPFLTLFAAAGLIGTADMVQEMLGRRSGGSASGSRRWLSVAAVAATALLAHWPMVSASGMRAVSETNLGAALQSDRRLDEAVQHYRRAIEWRPDYAPAHSNLAAALRDQNKLDEAVRSYEEAIRLAPGFADAHYNLANLLLDEGDAAGAVDHLQSALRAEPGTADAHNNLGIALASTGRIDEAVAEFREVIALDPTSPKGYRNLGRALASKGDGQGAIDAFQRTVELDPANPAARDELADAHNAMGIALGTNGKLAEAVAEFRRALEISPSFEAARTNLAIAERSLPRR